MNTDAKKQKTNTPIEMNGVEEFVQWVQKVGGPNMLYRGLADKKWKVESAAYRRITESGEVEYSDQAFDDYIKMQLLDKARRLDLDEHNGERLRDLKLLAKLQHFGAATCMIDFTRDPLVALWFACQKVIQDDKEQNGMVVVMDTAQTDIMIQDLYQFRTVGQQQIDNDIKDFLDTGELWMWSPIPRDNRVIAQHSVFVFGQAVIADDLYTAVHIPVATKEEILTILSEKFKVSEENLFSDFAGFALANAHNKPCGEYSADAYYDIAIEYWRKNEMEKAKYYCNKAIEKNIALDSRYIDVYHLRGNVHQLHGECDQYLKKTKSAIASYTEAIDNYERADRPRARVIILLEHNQTLISRGKAYVTELQFDKAIDDYTKAIEIAKDRKMARRRIPLSEAYYYRGLAEVASGKYDKAIIDFDFAIDTYPDYAKAYLERAKSHRALGNFGLAEADKKKAFDLDPQLKKDSDEKNAQT